MNRDEQKCCGTCRFNKPSWETGHLCGFHCMNEEGEAYGLETAYDDSCEEWEARK